MYNVSMLTTLYTVCVFATIEGIKYTSSGNTCLTNSRLISHTAKTGQGENNCFKLYTIKLAMRTIL